MAESWRIAAAQYIHLSGPLSQMGIQWDLAPCPSSRRAGAGVRKKGGDQSIRIRDKRKKRAPLIGAGWPAPPRAPGVGKSWIIRLIATAPDDRLLGPYSKKRAPYFRRLYRAAAGAPVRRE